MNEIRVAALYRFIKLPEHAQLKAPLLNMMHTLDIKGTVLLAPEGINGTVSGSIDSIDEFIKWLRTASIWMDNLASLEVKYSTASDPPFARAKVKLKKEIVTMGMPDLLPEENSGAYLEPEDWNALISQPDVLTIDTRNNYETKLGQFSGARNPETSSFREFPDFARESLNPREHKKIAMYCTGGIRCEKSTAYLKSLGFDEVYHLRGGILKYLETVPQSESLWQGECFVFDERVAIGHDLLPGNYVQCHACRLPLTKLDLDHPHYVAGESCHQCYEEKTDEQRARYRERQKQVELAKARGETHIGDQVKETNAQRRAEKYGTKGDQREDQRGQQRDNPKNAS